MNEICRRNPGEIEAESFRIIEEELGPTLFSKNEFAIVRRMIHATGDFEFARNVRFHPKAVESGLKALENGSNILVDVHMAAAGISHQLLEKQGGRVICHINDPRAAELAGAHNITRSEAAVELASDENIGIAVIGNAPTALLKVMDLLNNNHPKFKPGLVIGVPVGFVNAAESKELLAAAEYPFITSLGRKGGTPVAVAIVNALLRLAGTGSV